MSAQKSKNQGKAIGYIRVSTLDQNTERQFEGVALDRAFTDKASGKDAQRPQLEALLDYAREGDTVLVHSIDRLARNLEDLRRIVRELTGKGVVVEFVKERLTFTAEATPERPWADLMLNMLGAFAEFERALIKERQREGITLAKAKGVYKGRKKALGPEQVAEARKKIAEGAKKAVIARELGISRETLYQSLRAA